MTRPSAVAAKAAERVRIERKNAGLTQRDLAERCGLTVRHVAKIENGAGATLDNLAALARGLGISLKELVP